MKSRLLVVDDSLAIHDDYARVFGHNVETKKRREIEKLEKLLFGDETAKDHDADGFEFEVDRALQGEEALKMAEAAAAQGRPYAVVFLDRFMPPGWDGIRTAKEIWKCVPDTQIVMVSAFADAFEIGQSLFEKQKDHQLLFLRKPFDGIIIRHIATCLVEKWSQTKRLRSLLEDTIAIPVPKAEQDASETKGTIPDFLLLAEKRAQPLLNAYRIENYLALINDCEAVLQAGDRLPTNPLTVCASRLIEAAEASDLQKVGRVLQVYFEQLGAMKQAWRHY